MKNAKKVIERLRKNGYNVHIKHLRIPQNMWSLIEDRMPFWHEMLNEQRKNCIRSVSLDKFTIKDEISPRGGIIEVVIRSTNHIISTGESYCSPFDNFQRKLGLNKALGRAISNKEIQEFLKKGENV